MAVTPEKTVEENFAKADHWLNRAISFEAEGKANQERLAFKRALEYENVAVAMKAAA